MSQSIVIRDAVEADVPAIAELGERFFNEAGWRDIAAWDPASIEATLRHMISTEIVLVAENGAVVGMAGGLVFPQYFNHHQLTGQEVFLWVKPDYRTGVGGRLLSALENRARERGALTWTTIAVDKLDPEPTARLYARRGYRPAERSFVKVL